MNAVTGCGLHIVAAWAEAPFRSHRGPPLAIFNWTCGLGDAGVGTEGIREAGGCGRPERGALPPALSFFLRLSGEGLNPIRGFSSK